MTSCIIRRWRDVSQTDALRAEVDEIFFGAAALKDFPSDEERAAFRERWLGRYLTHDVRWFYVAITESGKAVGYLAGSIDNPAQTARFSDLPYYAEHPTLMARYPAHLHINLAENQRSAGTGSALVRAFADDAAEAGAPGVHVVTGPTMRNVRFYEQNGFRAVQHAQWNGREIVFLGRDL